MPRRNFASMTLSLRQTRMQKYTIPSIILFRALLLGFYLCEAQYPLWLNISDTMQQSSHWKWVACNKISNARKLCHSTFPLPLEVKKDLNGAIHCAWNFMNPIPRPPPPKLRLVQIAVFAFLATFSSDTEWLKNCPILPACSDFTFQIHCI